MKKFSIFNFQFSIASGFTLVEILVVISIIGILSTVGLINYSGTQAKARDSIRKADLQKLSLALEGYFQKNNTYILPADTGVDSCQRDTDKFYQDITPFFQGDVPKDPQDGTSYCYIAVDEGTSYRLFSKLERCDDPGVISGIDCQQANWTTTKVSDDLDVAFAPGDFILPADPTAYRRVFTTSTRYPGNMGGLAGADAKCQARANVANLGGIWKAWLSDSTKSPANQSDSDIWMQTALPYRRLDGITIARNWSDLVDGSLTEDINLTELNQNIPYYGQVWTNTQIDGSVFNSDSKYHCINWTSSLVGGTPRATIGTSFQKDARWTLWPNGQTCSTAARLYCIEQ